VNELQLSVAPDLDERMIARVTQADGMTVRSWFTAARVGEEARADFDRIIDADLGDSSLKRAGATDWTRPYAPVVAIEYVRPQAVNVPTDETRMANKRQTLNGDWVPMLTVGELKQILLQSENLRDSEPIVLWSGGEWHYMASYNLSGDDGYDAGLTLHPGSVYDSRNH
jgi:hypothetical protein